MPVAALQVGDVITFRPPAASGGRRAEDRAGRGDHQPRGAHQRRRVADAAPTGLPLGGRPLARVVATLPHLGHAYLVLGSRASSAPCSGSRSPRCWCWCGPPAARRGRHPGPAIETAVRTARERSVAGSMLLAMAQRVLVVEDEEDIAFPLVRTLEREGYDVAWVENGAGRARPRWRGPRRRRHPRPRPARHRRARGLPPGPRGRVPRRDHDRHRPRRRARPRGRARLRRRRLPRQAVRPGRAPGAGARAAAAHRPARRDRRRAGGRRRAAHRRGRAAGLRRRATRCR